MAAMNIGLSSTNINLLIVDFDYIPLIYRYKNEHKELKIKIMTRDEAIDNISINFKKDPIPFLISLGIEYSKAKQWIQLLRVSNYSKNEKLLKIYNLLLNNDYLSFTEYGKYNFLNKEVFLLELNEDKELKQLLTRNDIRFLDLSLSDLSINIKESFIKPKIINFNNKFEQFFYIYSSIRKDILNSDKYNDDIKILATGGTDLFYFKFCSSLFKIPAHSILLFPLMSNVVIKNKVREINKTRNFIFNDEELNNEYLSTLSNLIKFYGLDKLKDFNYAYSNLLEIVASNMFKTSLDDKGIVISDKYSIDGYSKIYITNFSNDNFYKMYQDKNVLSDVELEKIDANPSYVKTLLDKRKKLNYIKYNNVLLYSRVKHHLSDSIYDSNFIEELKWKASSFNVNENVGSYTLEASKLLYSHRLDNEYITKKIEDINSYSHAFKGINAINQFNPTNKNRSWSVTKLEQYINCPFKYYMEELIPLKNEDYYMRIRGTIIHKVLENIYKNDFDFNSEFDNAVKEINKKNEISSKEMVWLELVKCYFSYVVKSILERKTKHYVVNPLGAEYSISFNINEHAFKGKIDRILWTNFNNTNFYSLIDYKSGNESFNIYEVCLGKSIQLPLYYYAIKNDKNFNKISNGGEFGGFGIQKVFFSTIKKGLGASSSLNYDNLLKYTRISGIVLSKIDYWQSIDPSIIKEDDKHNIVGFKTNNSRFIVDKCQFTSEEDDTDEAIFNTSKNIDNILGEDKIKKYNLSDVIKDAKESALTIIDNIINCRFDIKPTSFNLLSFRKDNLACKFCKYNDICYRNGLDAYNYINEVIKRFRKKDDGYHERN